MKIIRAGKYQLELVVILEEQFYEIYKSVGYNEEINHEFIGEADIDLIESCRLENGDFDCNAIEEICASLDFTIQK